MKPLSFIQFQSTDVVNVLKKKIVFISKTTYIRLTNAFISVTQKSESAIVYFIEAKQVKGMILTVLMKDI